MRELYYHEEPGKTSPRAYIDSLKPTEKANIDHRLEVLREYPIHEWPSGWVKKIENKIWELKSDKHRILYFITEIKIVVVHAFKKSGKKTKQKDIRLAQSRYNDYYQHLEDNS